MLRLCLIIILALTPSVLALTFLNVDVDDIKIQQALLAGGLVATGWVVTFGLRELQRYLERRQKSVDLQHALRGEIFDYADMLDDGDPDQIIATLKPRILSGNEGEKPFFPFISEPVVFDNLVGEIYFLPKSTIDDVVQFYSILSDVRLFAEDFRSEAFGKLSDEGTLNAYSDYIRLRGSAKELADKAVGQLNDSLGVKPQYPAADLPEYQSQKDVLEDWLNTQTSDREGL